MRLSRTLLLALAPLAPLQEGRQGPAATWLEEETIVVPLDLSTGHPVVQVSFGERGSFPLILDTGASGTVLDADLAAELGLEPTGRTTLGDPSNPEAHEADLVTIPGLGLAGALFDDLPAVSWDRPAELRRGPTRGILGLPTFESCLFTLDYAQAELRLTRGALPPPEEDASVVAIHRRDAGLVSLPLELPSGEVLDAHLDTGNAQTVLLPARFEPGLVLVEGSRQVQHGLRASGPVEIVTARLSGRLRLGSLVLEDPEIRLDPKLDHANVGRSVLERALVTVDLTNERVRILPRLEDAHETGR